MTEHVDQPEGRAMVLVRQADGKRAWIIGNLELVRLYGHEGTRGSDHRLELRLSDVQSNIWQGNLELEDVAAALDRMTS